MRGGLLWVYVFVRQVVAHVAGEFLCCFAGSAIYRNPPEPTGTSRTNLDQPKPALT